MNKTYLNAFLIVLLVVIWGALIYKYFGPKSVSQPQIADFNPVPNFKPNYSIVKDTFPLKLVDRDPFGITRVKTAVVQKPKPKPIVKPVKKKILKWPSITYHGFVKGNVNATRLILVKVNNRIYRKREKESINEMILLNAYHDSLIVSIGNNTKTIQKQ